MLHRPPQTTDTPPSARRRRRFKMHVPVVTIALDKRKRSTTPAARWSREYRERQSASIGTGRRTTKDPVGIVPVPMSRSQRMLYTADRRFKQPPPGASEYDLRVAIGRVAALMLRDGK